MVDMMNMTSLLMILVVAVITVPAQLAHATVTLAVNASDPGRQMPSTLFGLFFEEINHAGSGGLWAELVQNRGFEAGGQNTPSIFEPWYKVGDQLQVSIGTELSSPFQRNPVALKIEVLCDSGDNSCPSGGVGAANPGFWGMSIVAGSTYKVELWVRSKTSFSLSVAFTSSDGTTVLAQSHLSVEASEEWSKRSVVVAATSTDHNARLALTSATRGVFWVDQVSALPTDTYKGHGFRKELATMIADLKPGFLRFPGGCYVEGQRMANAFRWRDSVGPYEERPGHYGDVWNYWTDDGFGYFEGLQLAEDLGTAPIWVFNNGVSHEQSVATELIGPFVQNVLDGIEFARGPVDSTWGAVRAEMGHPEPFQLQHVAVGNEDCNKPYYTSNYMEFYNAIKLKYPDIQIISNCDASIAPLDHPADLYDYHIYTNAKNLFAMRHQFDHSSRSGPKAFVSEYAVTGTDSGTGSLYAALAEAAFLIGIELNSDLVQMASYAPLFVNANDRRWNPDAIVFNSNQQYGTPSYWMQHFFKSSNGAHLIPSTVQADSSTSLASIITSAVRFHNASSGMEYLIVKAVNFGNTSLNVNLAVTGISASNIIPGESNIMVMTSSGVMDENSFTNPVKVAPQVSKATNAAPNMELVLPANSIVALELGLAPALSSRSESLTKFVDTFISTS
ncbi:hypothetical protein KC19_9G026500 [Ceratodon purpureus]|uniref:non-reducing end alpha-L-arabinofuranosidase n=2 Tax=Ceratodon purpureus TaxID=3225 RepID=A0A8T0GTI3_CERPU|nr:hypothetical protein KC19_9G026500 [Ceratodon purpureus]KAG0560957.1 hypothetical protein KC19_9G026500 [Ceratodon purpureus]KAG0560958.1 hypothetical protein KC19_9G026500 [Ceratodon purpureus]KAG0560959.1 hypothetical protein KC19_9G026500 [Ceratodon purpureus]